MIQRLFRLLVRLKVYMARTASYIAMLNSAMILFLLMSNLEKYGIDLPIERYLIPIVLISIVVMVAWGYIEDKIGLWEYEQKVSQDRSLYNQKILTSLNSIEDRLDIIEKKLR